MKRRLLALLVDYCVVLGWLAAITLVGYLLTLAGLHLSVIPVDVLALLLSVGPVWLYLVLTEAGPRHATWGKRRLGLRVTMAGGGTVSLSRVAVRNTVKLLPWQLAHLGVAAYIAGGAEWTLVSGGVAWLPIALTYLLVAMTFAMAFLRRDRAALHDLVAGTRVLNDAEPG